MLSTALFVFAVVSWTGMEEAEVFTAWWWIHGLLASAASAWFVYRLETQRTPDRSIR